MSQTQACVFAAMILAGTSADGATIQKVCKAGGIEVSKSLANSFATFLAKADIENILSNVSFGGGAAAGAAPAGGAAPAAGGNAKAPEPEEEEDDDMGMGLFD